MKKSNSYIYLNNNSILVINPNGKLRTIYTPFRVKCVSDIQTISSGSWVIVDEVRQSQETKLIYVVQGREVSYKNFEIQIKF